MAVPFNNDWDDDDDDHSDHVHITEHSVLKEEVGDTEIDGVEHILKALMCTGGTWLRKLELFAGNPNAFYKAGTFILYGPPGCGHGMIIEALAESVPGCKLIHVSCGSRYETKDLLGTEVLQEMKNNVSVVELDFDNMIIGHDPNNIQTKDEIYQEVYKRVTYFLKSIELGQYRCVVFLRVDDFQRLPQCIKDQFGTHIYVPLPDHQQRLCYIKTWMRIEFDDCSGLSDQNFEEMCNLTDGWSYRDIQRAIIGEMVADQRFNYAYKATHFVIIPSEPCSECIAVSETDPSVLMDTSRDKFLKGKTLCHHQKVHRCSPETPGAFKKPSEFWGSRDYMFLPGPNMDTVRKAISMGPDSPDQPEPQENLEYYEDYITSHGHYTAYIGNSTESFTDGHVKSPKSLYSLKQLARMKVFKCIDHEDGSVMMERALQLEAPMILRLYVLNENILSFN